MQSKADRYANIKYAFAIADILYTIFLLLALQLSGMSRILKIVVSSVTAVAALKIALYCAIIFIFYSLLTFGLDLYSSFVVEHYFGLSKQKLSSWLLDYIKSTALGFVVFIVLMECFYIFIGASARGWWWMSASFWALLTVVIARIFPVVVIPLFFKYKNISDESLRSAVFALAKKMQVKVLDIFEIDYSKKSLKANAAFVGIGSSRRVLLTDTLLNGRFGNKEIEAVLAHEFAHFKHRHLLKMVIMSSLGIFVMFYIFFLLDGRVFTAGNIADLGWWLLLFMLFQLISAPLVNLIHRKMEKNADAGSLKAVGDKEAFISMMNKLADQNLAQRKVPLWAKIFFYDHPPVSERIEFAQDYTASV